jgi:tetratricopeptide (TPR) repeat protein
VRAVRHFAMIASLLSLCAASAWAQAANPAKPRGTTQKVGNPLNDLLEEAKRAIDRQEFEAAVAPLQKVIAEEPGFAYGHFQLGYVFTALKRWDDAKREYQRAAELDPKMAEAHLNLGMLLLGREPGAAVAPLRKAVELLPSQSRPRFLLGVALEEAGDLKGAVEALKAAESLDPRDFETRLELARVFLSKREYPDAEGKFREALALQADSAEARRGLANALSAQHKPEAAEAFKSYLELQPSDRAAAGSLARILFRAKDYEAALAALDRADPAPGTEISLLDIRADIQIAQAHWDDAIITLKRVIALAPYRLDLREGLGRIYLEKKEYAAAEKELQAVLQADRNYAAAWKDLGTAYYLEGNCPAALATLDEVARREELNAGAWFVRATCYDKLKMVAEALSAYEKFREIDHGQNANQEWQAEQRIKTLRRVQEKKH